jgi:DNA-binding transcriptional LysR family regulator
MGSDPHPAGPDVIRQEGGLFCLLGKRCHQIITLKLRDLEYLVASAAEGNFSRAARSLGISTSTISRRVGRFEDELGLAVFERGHKGIRLTKGGKAVLLHARRAVAELEAVKHAGRQNGIGAVGEVRLGVRIPPIGESIRHLLMAWRQNCPDVLLAVSEMNERDLGIALDERRLDVALAPAHALPPRFASEPVYRERFFAAVPRSHGLARRKALAWPALSGETILVQGWEESQAEREFLAPLLGAGANFRSHAASRQSILALVAAGFGTAIVAESEAKAGFPRVAFRPIDEPDAFLQLDLGWLPEAEEPAVGRFVAFIRDAARSSVLV